MIQWGGMVEGEEEEIGRYSHVVGNHRRSLEASNGFSGGGGRGFPGIGGISRKENDDDFFLVDNPPAKRIAKWTFFYTTLSQRGKGLPATHNRSCFSK